MYRNISILFISSNDLTCNQPASTRQKMETRMLPRSLATSCTHGDGPQRMSRLFILPEYNASRVVCEYNASTSLLRISSSSWQPLSVRAPVVQVQPRSSDIISRIAPQCLIFRVYVYRNCQWPHDKIIARKCFRARFITCLCFAMRAQKLASAIVCKNACAAM